MARGSDQTKLRRAIQSAALVASVAAVPAVDAQQLSDDWRFGAAIYGYFPSVSGTVSMPTGNARSVEADADQLLRNLEFAFMGSLEVTKGRWGAFTDVMYFDIGGSKTGTGTLAVSGLPLPPGVSAYASLDIETTVWTLAGTYRVVATPDARVDLIAGARMLDVRTTLNWQFSADFGPFVGPGRGGSGTTRQTNWDAIVGVKGRVNFGESRRWFVPYYLDVGTGESDLTWQAIAGLGYAFDWGDVIVAWRHLDYEFKSTDKLQGLAFDGPAVGVAFRW